MNARTLYDALAKKGMTTGQVDWVAIYGAKNVRWQFGEKPEVGSVIVQDLMAKGVITQDQVEHFDSSAPAWRDEMWTDGQELHPVWYCLAGIPNQVDLQKPDATPCPQ